MGGTGSQIATLVERQSRYVMLVKVPSKDTMTVTKALTRKIRELPAELCRSLTWDRGSEMAAHKEFAIATDMQVYFCDPHSPWQRRQQRKHQRPAAPVLPQGHGPLQYQPGAARLCRQRAKRASSRNLKLAHPVGSAKGDLLQHELSRASRSQAGRSSRIEACESRSKTTRSSNPVFSWREA